MLSVAGNLYGTTFLGVTFNDGGTIFELTPTSEGWTETPLHNFGQGTDGINPRSSLIIDATGNLFGTTTAGGAGQWGTVFEIKP